MQNGIEPMNDPHVERLFYKLENNKKVSYRNPPPVKYVLPECELFLENGLLTVEMKAHFASTGSAIDCVTPILRAWEIKSELDFGPQVLTFTYERAEIKDRKLGESQRLSFEGSGGIKLGGSAEVVVEYPAYPGLPNNFKASELVTRLFLRYKQYKNGKEPLASMAYYCYTAILNEEPPRNMKQAAAKHYMISLAVLNRLSTLTTNVGDEKTARKMSKLSENRAFTNEESNWIESAIKIIIKRVAEVDANPGISVKEITMSDIA